MKSIYIYIILLAVVVTAIILLRPAEEESTEITSMDNPHGEMQNPHSDIPDDDIHKSFKNPGGDPNKENVSTGAKHKLEMLAKKYEDNPSDTLNARMYAEMLAGAHQPGKSVKIYESILKIDPNRVDILLGVTFVAYRMQDFVNAENYTNRILKIAPENHEANYNLGAIEASKGNNDKAKKIWEGVIKKFPGSDVAKLAESSIERL